VKKGEINKAVNALSRRQNPKTQYTAV